MAMVNVDGSSLSVVSLSKFVWLGLKVGSQTALGLHPSDEPRELSHDDRAAQTLLSILNITKKY